jgi:4-amino-4-deoxy-L-arabinose transferase-like glycosyltransferase
VVRAVRDASRPAEPLRVGRPAGIPRTERFSRPSTGKLFAVLIPVGIFLVLGANQIRLQRAPDYDERIFLDVGSRIFQTGVPIRSYGLLHPAPFFDHTPLYAYFVALLTSFGGDAHRILTLGRGTSLLCGLGTVILVFLMASQLRGAASGFVAALLVASNPLFSSLSWFLRMEVPLCFLLVLALYALLHERFLAAGLAIAGAVLLKEIALAFWLVAITFVLIRYGWRRAFIVGVTSLVALASWLAYAWLLSETQLVATMNRWFNSSIRESQSADPRLRVSGLTWLKTIAVDVLSLPMLVAAAASLSLALKRRQRLLPLAWIPLAYVVLAIGSSFVIRLKEPRYLIAVIPMTALLVGLLVDWGRLGRGHTAQPVSLPSAP